MRLSLLNRRERARITFKLQIKVALYYFTTTFSKKDQKQYKNTHKRNATARVWENEETENKQESSTIRKQSNGPGLALHVLLGSSLMTQNTVSQSITVRSASSCVIQSNLKDLGVFQDHEPKARLSEEPSSCKDVAL